MPFGEKVARPNTLVFQVPEALRVGSRDEFLEKLISALRGLDIRAIQFVPNYHVRVTFESLDARNEVFRRGLKLGGVLISLIEADPSVCLVYLHNCPVEVPNSVVKTALSDYGDFLSIERLCHTGTAIQNGSRTIKLIPNDDIPSKLHILRYPCRVWYAGQPQVCHICEASSHRAAECPLKGLCRRCKQPGHVARDCQNPPPPNPSAASTRSAPPSDVPTANSSAAAPVGSAESSCPAADAPPAVLTANSSATPLADPAESSSLAAGTPNMDTTPDDIRYAMKRPAADEESSSSESTSSATSALSSAQRIANVVTQVFRKKRISTIDPAAVDASASAVPPP